MDYYKDNPYIINGYRHEQEYKGWLHELFSWHNETINAWTMILAFFIATFLCVFAVSKFKQHNTRFAILLFYTHILIIVPASVNYHLKANVSSDVRATAKRIDVLCVFIASIFLTLALSWNVFPLPITITLAAACLLFTIKAFRTYDGKSNDKKELAKSYLIVVLIYLSPLAFKALSSRSTRSWQCFIWVVFALIAAAILYVFHIPERWYPGAFDYIGCSHQLMHLCLIIANVAEFFSLII